MKDCAKCKYKDTLTCGTCEDGSLWEETKGSFDLIISAIMFGCGIGGVIAFLYTFLA